MFSEIELFGEKCRYTECTHTHETDCAVKEAVETGKIAEELYNNYLKLRKELEHLERKTDYNAAQKEQQKWKTIKKEMRHFYKKDIITRKKF